MTLEEFAQTMGESFVRCNGKERIDPSIVSVQQAQKHLDTGGSIGWWVRSGYIVVDVDEGREEIVQVVKRLKVKTLMCKTPKGLHIYFRTQGTYPQKVSMVLPCGLKCDYRCANKGYVLLPFGQGDRKFNKIKTVAEMPLELTPMMERKDSLLGLGEGEGRNTALFSNLMAYKNRGADEYQIDDMAHIVNDIVFKTPMPEPELAKILTNVEKYDASFNDNPYLIYNNKGVPIQVNARAIVDHFVNRGDVTVTSDECYVYREGCYREASSYIRNAIKEMIAVDSLISHSRIMECYKLLIDDTRIQAHKYNDNYKLINFVNGVWSTESKELLEHDSKYKQTIQIPHKIVPVGYLEDTPFWHFLELTGISEDNIEMLLDFMAYCMTTDYGLKAFMILYGPSNTGKSVLVRMFEHLLGKANCAALSMQDLSMRFYPSQLFNRLLNCCADNSSLPLRSIENLKKVTGGDTIMHEKKGADPFFFVPFAKLLFSFNQLPLQLEEKSNAFYKRMRILLMDKELYLDNAYVSKVVGCSEEIIPHLLKRLPLKEIPDTKESARLVRSLRMDSDSIHAFIETCCIRGNYICNKEVLYEQYMAYCIKHGREGHKQHSFIRNLRSLGLKDARTPERAAGWKGLRLK